MKRRNFLKLFALGAGTAALPSIVTANSILQSAPTSAGSSRFYAGTACFDPYQDLIAGDVDPDAVRKLWQKGVDVFEHADFSETAG